MGTWITGFDGNPLYVLAPGEKHPDTTNAAGGLVDAHSQMLAARVEGLEKDINGLQHVWTRVKVLEAVVGELRAIVQPGGGHVDGIRHDHDVLERRVSRIENSANPYSAVTRLLRLAVEELPPNSPIAHDIVVYLRNR
jgi:hypothetical protein